jgi:RNA polymerase sigma-70 factor (ECF subfamily)
VNPFETPPVTPRVCYDGFVTTLDRDLLLLAERAAAAWPTLDRSPEEFATFLRDDVLPRVRSTAVEELHADDLFLVWACRAGDARAWRELDRLFLAKVAAYVSRIDPSPSFGDEIRQRLAEKLMHGRDGGVAKLAQYTGMGPLAGWIRVAAVREAHNARRDRKPNVDADDTPLVDGGDDPELLLLKQRYASEFKQAFASVLASLSADERNVLRLHYLDGLTIEETGRAYGVSRATAARHIAAARERIIEAVNGALRARLGQGGPDADSVLALVKSQLDLSLKRHFKA